MRELSADATEAGRFLVVTASQLHDERRSRVDDLEAYFATQSAEQQP